MTSSSRRQTRDAGFTLIEIMVALAILAGLTMLTANAIKSAVDNRALISREISRDERLSSALSIIRSDIAGAFHHQDVFTKVWNKAISSGTTASNPGGVPGGGIPGGGLPGGTIPSGPDGKPAPTPRPTPPQLTGFSGSGEAMYFTSLTNQRTLRDSQESSQAKIGYFVKSCKSTDGRNTSKCLFRSSSPYIDENLEEPGPETVLVENVEEFSLRYFSPNPDDEPRTVWRTGKNGDDLTKENFPVAVEVTLTLHNKNDKKDHAITQTVLAPILFPNNPPPKKAGADGQQQPQQPSQPGFGG